MNQKIKISQLPAKGANLDPDDLLEIAEFTGTGYVSKSITGQEIIDAAAGSGVTDVTGTAPIASTGGTTPDISISQAGAATDGYLSTGDWNAFNNKQDALSSGVNIKTINSTSVLGSGNIAVQPTLVSGTNIKTIEGQSLLGSGDINLTASDVGLGNVDNTSDLNKPISTATQTALNAKQNTLTLTTTGSSGAATLVGSTLNIPQYGGGGASGIHTPINFNAFTSTLATSAAVNGTSIGTFTMQANQCIAYPYIPRFSFTANGFYLNVPVGVAGNLCRILVYEDTNGLPTTKLFESSNLDISTNGVKTATTSFSFTAGTTYWLAFHCNAVTSGSISGISVANAINIALSTITPITALTRTITFGTSSPSPMNPNQGVNSVLPFIGITKA